MTLEELKIVFTAQTEELNKAISGMKTQLKQLEKQTNASTGGVTKAFKGMAGKIVSIIGAIGIGKLLKDSIMKGMEAIENDNLVSTVFGGMTDDIVKWSNELQDSLGLNGYSVRKNTAMLYNMTKSMGLTSDQALKLGKEMTLLAEDVASFYNVSSEEAFNKIRAGIVGETEPLKQIGVLVDENTVKQYAYANGIANVGSQLTNSQKVLARQIAIQDQLSVANGDLARTINSPANQLRILRGQLELLMINLGQAFMPIVQIVLPILNGFIKALNKVISTVAVFMKALFGIEMSIGGGGSGGSSGGGGIGGGASSLGKSFDSYAPSLDNASKSARGVGKDIGRAGKEAKKLQGFLAGFDELNTVKKNDTGSTGGSGGTGGGGIGGGIGDIGGGIGDIGLNVDTSSIDSIPDKIQAMADKVKSVLTEFFSPFKASWEKYGEPLKESFKGLWESIKENFSAWGKLFENTWQSVKPFLEHLSGIFLGIVGIVADTFKWLVDIGTAILSWEVTTDVINGLFNHLNFLLGIVEALIYGIKTGDWSGAWNMVKKTWETFTTETTKIWSKYNEKIKEFFVNCWNKIKEFFSPMVNWFKTQWNLIQKDVERLTNIVKQWFKDWADKVKVWFGEWGAWFGNIWTNIKNGVGGMVTYAKGKFNEWKTNITNLFSGLGAWFSGIWKSIESGINSLKNSCKNIASTMWNNIKNPFVGAYNWFKSNVVDKITNAFSAMTKPIKGAFNSIISSVNWAIGKINSAMSFSIPDWVPAVGGKSFGLNIPKIPMLAKGGIVDNATLAMIGERGKEAVVPLENNTQWLDIIANKLSANMGNTGVGQGTPTEVIINIGGKQLGRYAIDSINKLQRQAGKQLIEIY